MNNIISITRSKRGELSQFRVLMGPWKFLVLLSAVVVQEGLGSSEENPLRLLRHERAAIRLEEAIELTVSPSLLNKTVNWVNVTWSGVHIPSKEDWIGVWLLPKDSSSIDPKKHAPVKYEYCDVAKRHTSSGSGQLRFYMVNMRGVFQFGLLRGGFSNPVLSAVSGKVTFDNPNEPLQGHLSLTNNYTEIVLMWVTRDVNGPQVKWGKTSGQYDNVRDATSSTYSATDMCDSPARDYGWIDPGMLHKVVMDGLIPGTKYYYIFGNSEGSGGWTDEQVFVAPPVPGPDVTTRVLAYGDLGHGEADNSLEIIGYESPSLNTTKRLIAAADNNDLVLHIGDICYAEGYAATWEMFFDQMNPLMLRLPYLVNTGNHESDSANSNAYYQGHDSGGECNVPYVHRFATPRPGQDQPWYGLDYGSIHIIMMSTEHDFRNSSRQYSALVKYFEAVDRTRTPWLIFSGHRPMYVDSTSTAGDASDQSVAKLLRVHVEPLLLKYKVDLVLWGHHHSYQRTCPVYNEACMDGAPIHIVIGMAGQGLSQNLNRVKPSYIEVVDDQHYGYTQFVANSTTLLFEYIRNVDGAKGDSFTLNKN